jgi:hypothetical protein
MKITTVTSNQGGVLMSWYFFLLLMILGGITVCLVLIISSKNPKEWRHVSLVHDERQKGNLKTLADSIKMLPWNYEGYSPVRRLMKREFFEKIKSMRGLTEEQVNKLYQNDSVTLRTYVKDPELLQWLMNQYPGREKQGFFNAFQKEKVEKKNQYQMELIRILEKMEMWGT